MEKVFIVKNPSGLNARAAMKLVKRASAFPCEVSILKDYKKVNAKSVMGVMCLGIRQGEQLTVITEGAEAKEALMTVGRTIESILE
ncbi:HPr family phosphocarrier protein [Aneurinibacillus tyrosinisolvens]|uniref:HPr family phosphocarrier protein n=1 Tax=Aneurinibacillus tyrosinisolvens TaxID=1443435 RepID=UPI00063FB3EE|nr:HPr family phosphocarrier protein [Aneurinibacillus tyrosinisolvens]